MEMICQTKSPEETARLGAALSAHLLPGDVVELSGDLGAGKSVLARGIAHALGVEGAMPSPTFTLMQPYQGRVPVYHFDLYRLEDEDEFYAAGLGDFLAGDGVALIEWMIQGLDVGPLLRVSLARAGQNEERRLALSWHDMPSREHAMRAALREWEETK